MSKRGRKGKVDTDDQLEIYCNCKDELIDQNGKIKPATAQIFSDLQTKLNMTQKAIQIAVTKMKEKIFGPDFGKSDAQSETNEDGSFDEHEIDFFSKDIFGATLTVSLNEAEQFNFDLITVQGPKRNYVILRPGWADKLFTIIVRETQSECCFQFKRVDVIETEFKTNAICAECNGLLSVFSILNRTKLKVQIHLGNKPHTYANGAVLPRKRQSNWLKN